MHEAHAHERLTGPQTRVFDQLCDHEHFLHGCGIQRCVVTTPGHDTRNGLGAVREVFAGPLHFVEEIVAFDPPRRFDYRIRRLAWHGWGVPIQHELGWLELDEQGAEIRVEWFSRFTVPIPLISPWLERRMGRSVSTTFGRLLAQAKRLA